MTITALKSAAAIAIFSIACTALSALDVSTNPVGCYTINCPANSDTHISIPVTRAPVFEGKVASIANGAIVFEGQSGFTENQFVYQKSIQSDHFYAVFTDGAYEGAWFNIISNTASSIVVESGESVLTSELIGTNVQIIPHWTLNTLFPNGAGVHHSQNAIPSSMLLFYSPELVGVNLKPEGFFFSDFGENSPYTFWCKLNDIDENGDYVNWNDLVIPPNARIAIRNPKNKAATTFSFSGNVKMFKSDITVGILADSTNQDNVLPSPAATSITLGELAAPLIDGGLLEKRKTPGDLLLLCDNSVETKNKPLIGYYYYFAGEGNAYNGWYLVGDETKMDNVKIEPTDVIIVRKAARLKAPFMNSTTFTPNYLK